MEACMNDVDGDGAAGENEDVFCLNNNNSYQFLGDLKLRSPRIWWLALLLIQNEFATAAAETLAIKWAWIENS